jgi:hypothetical protein
MALSTKVYKPLKPLFRQHRQLQRYRLCLMNRLITKALKLKAKPLFLRYCYFSFAF